jgi:hypothetical protein
VRARGVELGLLQVRHAPVARARGPRVRGRRHRGRAARPLVSEDPTTWIRRAGRARGSVRSRTPREAFTTRRGFEVTRARVATRTATRASSETSGAGVRAVGECAVPEME